MYVELKRKRRVFFSSVRIGALPEMLVSTGEFPRI